MSSSVICLHPVIEERGRIKADDDPVYRVSLRDCLACSGCAITEDEITLLSHQNPDSILQSLPLHPNFAVVISTVAVANLAAANNWSISKTFGCLKSYFTSHGAARIVTDSLFQTAWRSILLNCSQSAQKPLIISRCPGAILFFERKTKYANLLAPVKPFPNLSALYLKASHPFVVYVAPCYDRKLETGRFSGEVDATLTIGELETRISEVDVEEEESSVNFPPENDALYLLQKLTGINEFVQKESGQTTEYHIGDRCAAKICGEAALRRFCANLDRRKVAYDIVEADFCPLACASGGGLIRGASPATRKALVRDTIEVHRTAEVTLVDPEVESILEFLKTQNVTVQYQSVAHTQETDFSF
jgi:iron only hydrogenase large subunit-like protein